MDIKVKGIKELTSRLDTFGMRIKFAAMKAADDAAIEVLRAEREEIKKVFHNPTPWVASGIKMTNANERTLSASVSISDRQNKKGSGLSQTPRDVLAPHILGGGRSLKALEIYLREKNILPRDKYLAIGAGAWVDQYGNISGPEIVALLSQLKAFPESLNMNASMKRAGRKFGNFKYFVFVKNGVPLGIMSREKRSGGIQPIFVFISSPTYKRVFDFFGIGKARASAAFRIAFNNRLRA